MLPINQIIHGDCLEVMKDFPDKSIDCIITDPPYGISFKSNMDIKNRFDKIINDDNLDFFEPFIEQSYRVLKNNSCLFVFCRFDNYPFFYEKIKRVGFIIKNCLVWEKNKALGGLGDMESSFLSNYEFILFAMKGRKILFNKRKGRQFGLIKDTSIDSPQKLLYPTQKPIKILRKLIEISTNENDIILDSFVGSGSVCIASKQTKRNYIGIDLNEKAVIISNKRLNSIPERLFKWVENR